MSSVVGSVTTRSVQNIAHTASASSAEAPQKPATVSDSKPALAGELKSDRDELNWLIHLTYVRQDYDDCLVLVEQSLKRSRGSHEVAIYVKALIQRARGNLTESLQLFQTAVVLAPNSVQYLKQVGRSLYLLGRHKSALEIYAEAEALDPNDWENYYFAGLCHTYLRNYAGAAENFEKAIQHNPTEACYLQYGKLLLQQDKLQQSIELYADALLLFPDSLAIYSAIGLLYLRVDEKFAALDALTKGLIIDPRDFRVLIAAASVQQDSNEFQDIDLAMLKYRIAACSNPNSVILWNNVGMCFLGKSNFVAAIACLKRALYLAPFEWIVAYNLGLVYLHSGLAASAFQHFSSAVNLRPSFAPAYMYLGIALDRLDDYDNSINAYRRAIALEPDPLMYINFAILLCNHADFGGAAEQIISFDTLFAELDEAKRSEEPNVAVMRERIGCVLEANNVKLPSAPAAAASS